MIFFNNSIYDKLLRAIKKPTSGSLFVSILFFYFSTNTIRLIPSVIAYFKNTPISIYSADYLISLGLTMFLQLLGIIYIVYALVKLSIAARAEDIQMLEDQRRLIADIQRHNEQFRLDMIRLLENDSTMIKNNRNAEIVAAEQAEQMAQVAVPATTVIYAPPVAGSLPLDRDLSSCGHLRSRYGS